MGEDRRAGINGRDRAWSSRAKPAPLFPAPESDGRVEQLTEREIEVLDLVASGLSNKQIARALNITLFTAKSHVSRILHKLGVESRTEAAVMWAGLRTEG